VNLDLLRWPALCGPGAESWFVDRIYKIGQDLHVNHEKSVDLVQWLFLDRAFDRNPLPVF
jgi:hypothetical protein